MGKDLVQCHTVDENHYRTVVGRCNYTDEGESSCSQGAEAFVTKKGMILLPCGQPGPAGRAFCLT